MRRFKIAVLAGGKSAEHKISIASAKEVLRHLDPVKYEAYPVFISKDGLSWQILGKEEFLALQTPIQLLEEQSRKQQRSRTLERIAHRSMAEIKKQRVDIVFIALHGPFGEDGTVQGFLELLDIPYTGSKVLASALGMNKAASRKLFAESGLTVPKYTVLKKGEGTTTIRRKFKPPFVTKPLNQGSSVGVSIIHKKSELLDGLDTAFNYSDQVIIEEYLVGTEVTVGILGNKSPEALPVVEIVPKTEFFSFEAKYNESLCDEICPARISKKLIEKAQKSAILAYKTIGCRAFARVDMIIKDGEPHILEINTIPGLTFVSLVPKAAKVAGISYPRLLEQVISYSLE